MKIERKVINMPTPNSIDAHVGFLHLLGSIVKGVAVCCMVVTVTTISGVRTVPLERLMRLGFTWNTLLISILFYLFVCLMDCII